MGLHLPASIRKLVGVVHKWNRPYQGILKPLISLFSLPPLFVCSLSLTHSKTPAENYTSSFEDETSFVLHLLGPILDTDTRQESPFFLLHEIVWLETTLTPSFISMLMWQATEIRKKNIRGRYSLFWVFSI